MNEDNRGRLDKIELKLDSIELSSYQKECQLESKIVKYIERDSRPLS